MKSLLFLVCVFIVVSCSAQNDSKGLLIEYNRIKIENIIKNKFNYVSFIKIDSTYLESFKTYRDDGPFQKGIEIVVNKECFQISFQATTLNSDKTIKYIDTYQYLIPKGYLHLLKEGNWCFYKNSFHGKGYHGGSASIMKIEKWIQDVIDAL
jgi:hypothetical protein